MHQQAGAKLPPGCAIDVHGQPTVDPIVALAGAQLTFGAHKGSAISMMVELLSAGLTGGAFSFEARDQDPDDSNGTPTCNSELLIAIDPAQVRHTKQQ
jgi:delta1-piperideine-2-carboxylate reductase